MVPGASGGSAAPGEAVCGATVQVQRLEGLCVTAHGWGCGSLQICVDVHVCVSGERQWCLLARGLGKVG